MVAPANSRFCFNPLCDGAGFATALYSYVWDQWGDEFQSPV